MLTFILAVAVAVATFSPAPSPATAVGFWESATTSLGGIGHTLELRADGTFVEATTVIVDGYYRVIGDRLVTGEQPVRPDADASQAARITFDGKVFVETLPNGSVVRKERVGAGTESSPLAGEWRYHHYTDLTAFERYTDDGRMMFRLPMTSSAGRYTVKGNELLLVRTGQADARMAIDVGSDRLSLGNAGDAKAYRRAVGGPWYETEHIVRYPGK